MSSPTLPSLLPIHAVCHWSAVSTGLPSLVSCPTGTTTSSSLSFTHSLTSHALAVPSLPSLAALFFSCLQSPLFPTSPSPSEHLLHLSPSFSFFSLFLFPSLFYFFLFSLLELTVGYKGILLAPLRPTRLAHVCPDRMQGCPRAGVPFSWHRVVFFEKP